MTPLYTVKSYAKINIFLEITGKVGNLHKLHSLFCKVSLADTINILESNQLSITYINATVEGDIIYKTINALTQYFPQINTNFKFEIKKNIPIGSGLGGASSNAGEVLKFLIKYHNIQLTHSKLLAIGSEIGSDVPFFLCDSPMVLNGTGKELLRPNFTIPTLYCIIVHSNIELLTKNVFSKTQKPYTPFKAITSFDDAILRTNEMQTPANLLTNGKINATLSALFHPNAIMVRMSGSGSSCFALFTEESHADESMESLQQKGYLCVKTQLII